ncbi:MAG: hypothetical protein F2667_05985 [Actinobacteria bacterium]|nr:hypothetical protein [Actinomycetota bacterium]
MAAVALTRVLDDAQHVAPRPSPAVSVVEPGLATVAVQSLQTAIRDGDSAGAAALAPVGDERSAARLSAIVDNARELDLRSVSLRYVDQASGIDVDGRWSAAVDVSWQIHGFDPGPSRTEVTVHLRSEEGRVAVEYVGGGSRRSPLWLTDRLEVRRTSTTLVMAAASVDDVERYARLAERAVPTVRAVVPTWPGGLVVEVPRTEAGLDRMLDASVGTYSSIAAVTASVDGELSATSPVHVFVNPSQFDRLREQGAQVVMSHEATHAATGAETSRAPLWLIEGFADYVALRDVDLPITTTAAQAIEQVRADGPPAQLPGTAEFDITTAHLGAAYESAWIACALLAERGGETALVALYDATAAGADLDTALEQSFGLSIAQLTGLWQERLADLAL